MAKSSEIDRSKIIKHLVNNLFNGEISSFSKEISKAPSQISQWLSGNRKMTDDMARSIEAKLKIPLYCLDDLATVPNTQTEKINSEETVFVPRLDVRAKCGSGLLIPQSEQIIEKIWLTKEFIRRLPIRVSNKNNLSIIEAYDHSMDPTISDGDILLIDNGIKTVTAHGIYTILREGAAGYEIMIKRGIPLLNGGFMIKSDNKTKDHIEYTYKENDPHPIVAGRVVWSWSGNKNGEKK